MKIPKIKIQTFFEKGILFFRYLLGGGGCDICGVPYININPLSDWLHIQRTIKNVQNGNIAGMNKDFQS